VGLEDWRAGLGASRLWARDAGLWTGAGEGEWLGWLDEPQRQAADHRRLERFASDVRTLGFGHVLLIGMGGSSLAPEVIAGTLGAQPGYPGLVVLDSTDPAQVRAAERRIDPANTLFVVSSKSGTTLETSLLASYFLTVARRGSRWVAITDPGSPLERLAGENGFWEVFPGVPGIGGRFSALSNFGLVPAAAIGVDLGTLLSRTLHMVRSCGAEVAPEENPGVALGVLLGAAARGGRDKLTLVISQALAPLGAWLEQLIGESTGKAGRGILPVAGEPLGAPDCYGEDRLFVYVRLESGFDAAQDEAVAALERAGAAVARVRVPNTWELGKEFFRWEFATAVAASLLEINPFDQPDVEASKVAARKLMAEYERSGRLPESPAVRLTSKDLAPRLRELLARAGEGGYFAILAWVEMNARHEELLAQVRGRVRDRRRVATSVGFGPRFLHSSGQAFKGGAPRGVFLVLTCDETEELQVPGKLYSFGTVKLAQALGEMAVLEERGRPVLRVHLSRNVKADLEALGDQVEAALG
jgi:transaldolase/glucose-6-phosphate isomerase